MVDENETGTPLEDEVLETEVENEEATPGEDGGTPAENEEAPVDEEAPAEGEEPAEGEDDDEEEPEVGADGKPVGFQPNLKFKAGVYNKETQGIDQKEYDIDPRFKAIIKDKETQDLVLSLHQKAYGIDAVKDRLNVTREQFGEVSEENVTIKNGIQELRSVYQNAVSSGNYLKLDKFFSKLDIPESVILNYALEKVKLQDLQEKDPNQYQQIMNRQSAEDRAELMEQQRQQFAENATTTEQRLKQVETDFILQKPEIAALASEFDSRFPTKENAFRAAVFEEGQMAYFASKGKVNLTPDQAVKRVIERYALNSQPLVPQGQQAARTTGKKVVNTTTQRGGATLPNIAGRTTSATRAPKMKSIDDIKKYTKENYG